MKYCLIFTRKVEIRKTHFRLCDSRTVIANIPDSKDPVEKEYMEALFLILEMRSLNHSKQTSKLKITHRTSLVRKNSEKHLTIGSYDKKALKRLIKHLSKQRSRSKAIESCPVEDSYEGRIDQQVKLRCRQLPNVVKELRKAIMRQDWDEVTILVTILCHPGLKYYTSIILRVCFILLLNHPNSNFNLLQNFIRLTTEYVSQEDVNKFIKILLVLRRSALTPLKSGKYIRKTGDYKVTRDPEFEKL